MIGNIPTYIPEQKQGTSNDDFGNMKKLKWHQSTEDLEQNESLLVSTSGENSNNRNEITHGSIMSEARKEHESLRPTVREGENLFRHISALEAESALMFQQLTEEFSNHEDKMTKLVKEAKVDTINQVQETLNQHIKHVEAQQQMRLEYHAASGMEMVATSAHPESRWLDPHQMKEILGQIDQHGQRITQVESRTLTDSDAGVLLEIAKEASSWQERFKNMARSEEIIEIVKTQSSMMDLVKSMREDILNNYQICKDEGNNVKSQLQVLRDTQDPNLRKLLQELSSRFDQMKTNLNENDQSNKFEFQSIKASLELTVEQYEKLISDIDEKMNTLFNKTLPTLQDKTNKIDLLSQRVDNTEKIITSEADKYLDDFDEEDREGGLERIIPNMMKRLSHSFQQGQKYEKFMEESESWNHKIKILEEESGSNITELKNISELIDEEQVQISELHRKVDNVLEDIIPSLQQKQLLYEKGMESQSQMHLDEDEIERLKAQVLLNSEQHYHLAQDFEERLKDLVDQKIPEIMKRHQDIEEDIGLVNQLKEIVDSQQASMKSMDARISSNSEIITNEQARVTMEIDKNKSSITELTQDVEKLMMNSTKNPDSMTRQIDRRFEELDRLMSQTDSNTSDLVQIRAESDLASQQITLAVESLEKMVKEFISNNTSELPKKDPCNPIWEEWQQYQKIIDSLQAEQLHLQKIIEKIEAQFQARLDSDPDRNKERIEILERKAILYEDSWNAQTRDTYQRLSGLGNRLDQILKIILPRVRTIYSTIKEGAKCVANLENQVILNKESFEGFKAEQIATQIQTTKQFEDMNQRLSVLIEKCGLASKGKDVPVCNSKPSGNPGYESNGTLNNAREPSVHHQDASNNVRVPQRHPEVFTSQPSAKARPRKSTPKKSSKRAERSLMTSPQKAHDESVEQALHCHIRTLAGVTKSKDNPIPRPSVDEVNELQRIHDLDQGIKQFLTPHDPSIISAEDVKSIWPNADEDILQKEFSTYCRSRARQYGLCCLAFSAADGSLNDVRWNKRARAYCVDTFLCGVQQHAFPELIDTEVPLSSSRVFKLFDDHLKYQVQLSDRAQNTPDLTTLARQQDRRKKRCKDLAVRRRTICQKDRKLEKYEPLYIDDRLCSEDESDNETSSSSRVRSPCNWRSLGATLLCEHIDKRYIDLRNRQHPKPSGRKAANRSPASSPNDITKVHAPDIPPGLPIDCIDGVLLSTLDDAQVSSLKLKDRILDRLEEVIGNAV